jgi:hypothetical protein
VIAALLLGLVLPQQATAPDVMLAVDRDRVAPGEAITFTIRVSSSQADPIRVELPTLGGFELHSRSERSDVTRDPAPGRTTTIQLELRATTPGEWRLGPVIVHQGAVTAQSDPVTVTVEGGGPGPVSAGLSSRLARIIQRATPPPALGQAGISVAISDQAVPLGEQVDVVTIAWFERALRQQLRRAPTVESPRIEGVWSYPQPVPGGIAATREVSGRWYDLFVLHQVVFPLTPGRVAVSPARLQYSVPLAYQFFSQEESYKLETRPAAFLAEALPAEGRDPTFAGAVGRDLAVSETVSPAAGKQGEAFAAEIAVRGEGNVALWPAPDIRWPPGFRVYPEAAQERLSMKDGRLAGTKVFRYMMVADSAGALGLPALRYPYFDLGDGRYRVAGAAGALVVVAPRGETVASRAEPPPIRLDLRRPVALAFRNAVPGVVWWVMALLPPLLVAGPRLPRRRPAVTAPPPAGDPLARAERRLTEALRRPDVPPPDKATLQELKLRVQAARFAPAGVGNAGALARAVDAALARMAPGNPAGQRRWRERTGILVVLLLTQSAVLGSQTQPEEYYQAGAYRSAAEGFRRRALAAPDMPTHWFNLGNAAYRAGDDALALAAWVRAARLSPRDGGIRRARLLVAPADQLAADDLRISPVTPPELWLLGLVAWLVGWAGIMWSRRLRGRWAVLLAGGALLAAAAAGVEHWYSARIAVVRVNQLLRLSPHELAPAVGEVPRLGTVHLSQARGDWVLVDAGASQRGWLRKDGLEPLAGFFAR